MTAHATVPQAYRESAVLTAPPERLVVMLYDGAHRFLFQAAVAMRSGQWELTDTKLKRAEAIIDELLVTLDMSAGQIAERLQGIYVFCRRHLLTARMERDADKIDEVARILAELRDAWDQICSR